MEQQQIDTIRQLMEYEASRTAPPEGFPDLPDIPAGRYTDERFFELEKEHILKKSWLFAAHIDEVPEPGSYIVWENAGEPILITHTETGAVKAFYNVCSHRGAPVVGDKCGKRMRLTCGYHAWSYSLDGELMSIRDPEDFGESFDKSSRGLREVRCERFGNLIFVNFDSEAVTLLDWLGPVADEWKEFGFEHSRLAQRHSWVLDCNWKVAMEANTEVYHVKTIHPSTVAPILDCRRNVNTLYPNGHGRMIAPPPQGFEFPGVGGGMQNQPEFESVTEIGRTCTQSYGVFPNWVSPLSQYTLPPLLFWPISINQTLFETWTLAPGWEDGCAPDVWTDKGESLNVVLLEDTGFGEKIQKAMECGGFHGVPLSYQEARIYHWNQSADRMIGIENIPEELRVEQVIGEEWVYPNDPRLALMEKVAVEA
jgi:phenylpropionate dioxygenase-like ring-hydroxylating dioxygenase large terminal subunit